MQSVHLKASDVLYHEGDVSDGVYFIEAGEVEVRRAIRSGDITLAILGKGQIIGETSVVLHAPRSTSVVAKTAVDLAKIDADKFLEAFGGANDLGLKLLRMVCNRLSASNLSISALRENEGALRRVVSEIRLIGGSAAMSMLLGNTGVVVRTLPFEVGLTPPDLGRKTVTVWTCRPTTTLTTSIAATSGSSFPTTDACRCATWKAGSGAL